MIGSLVFLIGIYAIQYSVGLSFWNVPMNMGSIANFHTLFNISATMLFIPFHKLLEKLAEFTVREKKGTLSDEAEPVAAILDYRFLKSPSLAIGQAVNTAVTMGQTALFNFKGMRKLFCEFDEKTDAKLRACEESIDRMEDKLNAYLVELTTCELTDYENRRVTLLLHLTSEFERIGDYTMHLIESAEQLEKLREDKEEEPIFSDEALHELDVIMDAVEEIIGMAVECTQKLSAADATRIEALEEVIDYLNETLKSRHIERLKNGKCIVESGINFLELLINLERISDHCSNVGVYVIGIREKKKIINRHEYIEKIHGGKDDRYIQLTVEYMSRFSV